MFYDYFFQKIGEIPISGDTARYGELQGCVSFTAVTIAFLNRSVLKRSGG